MELHRFGYFIAVAQNEPETVTSRVLSGGKVRDLQNQFSPDVASFGPFSGLGHEITKLGVELLGERWSRNALVVAHYLVNVLIDLRMKDEPHQLRRCSIRWSSSSNDMPRDGFA